MFHELSNLPPGCTARMIDEQCADEWSCEACGETLAEDELCECGACLSLFCRECVEQNDASATDYYCATCAAARRIRIYVERFHRVAPNSREAA